MSEKKIIHIGASSAIGTEVVNYFVSKNSDLISINITRNENLKKDKNFFYIDSYFNTEQLFEHTVANRGDIVLLSFAHLGLTGYDRDLSKSLEIANQQTVFEVNLNQMLHTLKHSVNYLKDLGGTIIYLSSAAAYPVRISNYPYGISKKIIDQTIKNLMNNEENNNINFLSVKIGYVDTPLNHGRPKTPFSTTKEEVARKIFIAYEEEISSIFVPKSLSLVTKILEVLKPLTHYLDKKYT